jgi:uncharacterized protein YkwD
MTAPVRLLIAMLALAASVHCAARAGSAGEDKVKLTPEETKILELTNEARKEKKLPPLKVSPVLTEVARKHSANMAKQRKLDHKLDGKDPPQRIRDAGYSYGYWGENIVMNRDVRGAVEQSFKWWMESAPHRKNILNANLREIGVGMFRTDGGQLYFTQVFATPLKRR